MSKPEPERKPVSKQEIGERAINLAHDLESKSAESSMSEVHAFRQTMRPADYANMVRGIEFVNKNDREANPSLPKVLITDHGGNRADVTGVARDVVEPKVEAAEPKAPAEGAKQSDGNYSDTAVGLEKLWRDFFGH